MPEVDEFEENARSVIEQMREAGVEKVGELVERQRAEREAKR